MAARAALMLAAASSPASALAQDSAYTFEFVPYVWGARLDGNLRIGSLPALDTSTSFADILKPLDLGLMGSLEARRGKWALIGDALYIRLSESADVGPAARLRGRVTQQLYSGAVAYRFLTAPVSIDGLAGARYIDVKLRLEVTAGSAPSSLSAQSNEGLTDLFFGARLGGQLGPRWSAVGYVDFGGGGSRHSWQAIGGLGYEASRRMNVKFGYRYLALKDAEDASSYDFATHGPYLGVGIKF